MSFGEKKKNKCLLLNIRYAKINLNQKQNGLQENGHGEWLTQGIQKDLQRKQDRGMKRWWKILRNSS